MKSVFRKDSRRKERPEEPRAHGIPSGTDKPDARRKTRPRAQRPRPCDIRSGSSLPKKATREPRGDSNTEPDPDLCSEQ